MTGAEIVAEARSWIGVPYRVRGRSRQGIDCLGLLVMIGRHFEIPHVDEQEYSSWPRHDHLILRRLAQHLVRLPMTETPRPGLVGCFAERTLPGHVGIFSELYGALHLVHARVSPREVCEHAWLPNSEMRLIGLFAFPGMTD